MKYVLIFSTFFIILGGIERDMKINVYFSSCKISVILARFE